jgi:hypothetical protein
MNGELFSAAMLASLIWALVSLLPKAMRERDGLALGAALLTILLSLLAWMFLSGSVRSAAASADRAGHDVELLGQPGKGSAGRRARDV